MQYHVVPFTANIVRGQGGDAAATHMSDTVNHYAQQGWQYVRLENVRTIITTPATPGSAGCMGFGSTPGMPTTQDEVAVYMIVFQRP